jgi:hypothetical protein
LKQRGAADVNTTIRSLRISPLWLCGRRLPKLNLIAIQVIDPGKAAVDSFIRLASLFTPVLSALISGKFLIFPMTAMSRDHGDLPILRTPTRHFSTFVANKGTSAIRRLGGPCATLGWPLRGPRVALGWPNPKPSPPVGRGSQAFAFGLD